MIGIYKITSPCNKIYIGQSINIERRFKEYKIHQCFISIGVKLYNSLKKYGSENHKFEVVEECLIDQLNERETYWGNKFDVFGKNGLNLRLGNGKGSCSEETKRKISEGNKGKKKPNSGPKRQHILQYDLKGNFIKEWSSSLEASISLNIKKASICNTLKKRAKSAGKFIWKYKN